MNAYQNSCLTMAKSVYGLFTLEDNSSQVSSVPILQDGLNRLGVKIGQLEDLVLVQTDPSAAAEEKNQARARLISSAVQIAGSLLAHAHNTDDKKLERKARVTPSQLERAKDSKLVAICRGLINTAAPLTKPLKACNISAEQLATFKTDTDDYKTIYTKPRQAIATGRARPGASPSSCGRRTRCFASRLIR